MTDIFATQADVSLITDLRRAAGWLQDPIADLRLLAAGKFFGIPLSQAHAVAAVAHIDQLIANLRVVEDLLHDCRNDLFVANLRTRALQAKLQVEE